MISVFGAFALGDSPFIKMFGLGLATAVFLDATVVRMLIVPAVMTLFGERAWSCRAGSTASSPTSTSRGPSWSRPSRRPTLQPPHDATTTPTLRCS